MNVLLFSPYGFENKAAGAALFLAKYLRPSFSSLHYLECDGAFSHCSRDDTQSGSRSPELCLRCHNEQRRFSNWLEAEPIQLAESIARAASEVKEELIQIDAKRIASSSYMGHSFTQLLRPVIRSERFRTADEEARHKLLGSAAHHSAEMLVAAGELLSECKADIVFSAAQEDYLGQALCAAAKRKRIPVVEFRCPEGDQIQVIHPREGRMFRCNLTLAKLMRIKPDPREWPKEIRETLSQLSRFLGIGNSQIELLRSNE